MTFSHRRSSLAGRRGVCFFVSFMVCVAHVSLVSAQLPFNVGARLTDGTDTFDYTAGGNSNLPSGTFGAGGAGNVSMNFQLAGAPGDPAHQQVVSGNWFYRVVGADTRERHFADADARLTTGTDYVRYRFDTIYGGGASNIVLDDLWAEMDFKLTDTGPYSALCETQVCFHNDSDDPVDIEVFLAVDFHLNNSAPADEYAALVNGDLWKLKELPYFGLMYGPGAVGAAAGEVGSVMGAMTNNTSSDFTIPLNPLGGTFNNGAALLQFHQTVAGQTMFCPAARLAIGIGFEPPLFIPEPSSVVLLAMGAAVVLFRPVHERRRS